MWLRSTANSSQTDKKNFVNSTLSRPQQTHTLRYWFAKRVGGHGDGGGGWVGVGDVWQAQHFVFAGFFTATAHHSPPLRRSTVVRVIASQWQETRQPKCVALDKRCFFFTHACAQSLAGSSNEAEDKWRFSTPLRRFSILSATSLLLKEKFIWRHKSDLHREAMPRLLSEGTAKDGRLCVALKGFIQQLKQTEKFISAGYWILFFSLG